jgi:hypothetical protein
MYEAKKVFLHKHGLLFVGLYLLLTVLSLVLLDRPQNAGIEANKRQYLSYLQEFGGAYTTEKDTAIDAEFRRMDTAKTELQKLYDGYYNGKVTKDELTRQAEPLEAALSKQKGFDLFYDQYIYVRENPANRYFVYTNGWNGLLANDSLDIFFVLLSLLLVTPIFCIEQESSMSALLATVRKGGAHQAVCKIFLAFATVVALCAVSFGMQLVFFGIKYGLTCGGYPLQSLSYFASSSKSVSLAGAAVAVFALKTFGCLCFAAIILFVSKLAKRYAITVFSCASLILLPYFGLGSESAKYFMPFPLGFMTAVGFLRGNETKSDAFTDEIVTIFKEVPSETLLGLTAVTLLFCAVFTVITVRHAKNRWGMRGRKRTGKIMGAIMAFCLITAALGGCSTGGRQYEVFNHSTKMTYENAEYRVFVDESDLDDIHLVIEDKQAQTRQRLVRDPFGASSSVGSTVYGSGDFVYYAKLGMNSSKLKTAPERVSVVEVSLNDFSEKVLFEQNVTRPRFVLGAVSRRECRL